MRVGFTGTQAGMTQMQMVSFINVMEHIHSISMIDEFHHGDCTGSDEEAHELVSVYLKWPDIFIHPPVNQSKQAFCAGHFRFRPKPYLDRNHDIVDSTDVLVGTPKENTEQLRSGTWATIRYAKKKGKYLVIIWPDGSAKYAVPSMLGFGKSLPDGAQPNLVDLSRM